MDYTNFKNMLNHETINKNEYEHFYITSRDSLSEAEFLKLIELYATDISTVNYIGNNTNWFIMLNKGSVILTEFPGTIEHITDLEEVATTNTNLGE